METIPEITEAELDETYGGKGEVAACLMTVDGGCGCSGAN
jgi:hypothetical protein